MTLSWDKIKAIISKLKGLTTIGIAAIVGTAILTIFWLYLAQILTTSEYGEIGYMFSIASVAATISFLGAGNVIKVYRAKQVKIQASIYTLILISAIVVSLILYFILGNVSSSIYVIGFVIFGAVTSELLSTKLYKKYAKYVISQRILMVSFALALYYLYGLQGIILGFGLSFFPYSILLYHGFRQSKFNISMIKTRFKFIINSYIIDNVRIFNIHIDRLIIAPIFGFALLGNYQLGIQVVTMLALLPSIVYQYVLPRESSGQTDKKLKIVTVLFSAIGSILVITFSPWFLPIMFPKYEQVVEIVQIASLQVIPASITLMYMSKFFAEESSKIILKASGLAMVVRIPAIFVLGQLFGLNGIAVAFVLASSSEAFYLFISSRRKKVF